MKNPNCQHSYCFKCLVSLYVEFIKRVLRKKNKYQSSSSIEKQAKKIALGKKENENGKYDLNRCIITGCNSRVS